MKDIIHSANTITQDQFCNFIAENNIDFSLLAHREEILEFVNDRIKDEWDSGFDAGYSQGVEDSSY